MYMWPAMCAIPALGPCWPPAVAAKETNAQNPKKERLSGEFTVYLADFTCKDGLFGIEVAVTQKIIDELIYGEAGNEVVLIKYLKPEQLETEES